MSEVKLLSNGRYHVMVTSDGCGYSRWNDLAVTRWREDAALDAGGAYFYLRDADSGATWSPTARPAGAAGTAGEARFEPGQAVYSCVHEELECSLAIAVGSDADAEVRRLRVTNRAQRARPFGVTSCAEIVLAPPAADLAHPAFSKLFVQTEWMPDLRAIVSARRPSAGGEPQAWCFHTAVVHGDVAGALSFETDRARFIGRGRDTSRPVALDDDQPLSGSVGPVLDAVAALRVPIVLAAGATCTIDWMTGAAPTRADALAAVSRLRGPGEGDAMLAASARTHADTLRRLGATPEDARRYERFAGALLYADPRERGDLHAVAANRSGQSALWAFGISGDFPIVLLEVARDPELARVRDLVRAQAFWRAHGIETEALVVTGSATAAQPGLLERALRVADEGEGGGRIGQRGGLFLRDAATLDARARVLLASVARVVVRGDPRAAAVRDEGHPIAAVPVAVPPRGVAPSAAARGGGSCSSTPSDLRDFNGHGGFSADAREYVVVTSSDHPTPMPWVNVIANPTFGTLVSESGSACTWSENAHEFRLTPWSNDPVSDPNAEALHIRDEESGEAWSPTLSPLRDDGAYVARHGFGYSIFEHTHAGIETELRVFVAADAPVKFSMLLLRNRSGRARRLGVTGYVEWVLGDERAKTAMHVVTELDAGTGALLARNGYNTDFEGRTAFFDVDGDERSVCGDRGDFFGPLGSRAAPAGVRQPPLSGRIGAGLDPCGALRVALVLDADAERGIVFRLGCGAGAEEARALARRFRGAEAAAAAFDAARAGWRRVLGAVEVRTPDAAVDALANGWLTYQVVASRLWGRTAFFQSSGAYGFRDQLQDVMALVHARPDLVREHLLRAASRQFVEGDVQHWWHPPSGKGTRTRCSDDYLWLPYAIARYVEATADDAVLDVPCPFLEGRPLPEGEASDYAQPRVSAEVASVHEHAVRAIRHGLRFGAHGLPLMGTCDWNDGMNLVGAEGRGESVWLAFFLVAVLKRYAPVARTHGDTPFADSCEREAAALSARIEAVAWDGAWYRRAWFDDGSPLGSAVNAECRIDSISQSWAVLSGVAPPERARRAMEALDAQLVDRQAGLVKLLAPPFDRSQPSPGYIQGYVPGVRENGGQYTHAAVWSAMAFAALGDADRAWEIFSLLAPPHHGASAASVATYRVEPYVVAGDVYAGDVHTGRGGWTWYTGSAGWMLQLVLEHLLGLERRGNQLRLRPLLPRDWSGFEMRYRHGASTYAIACRVVAAGEAHATAVDGRIVEGGWVMLIDDGGTHAVTVDVPTRDRSASDRSAASEGEPACSSE